MNLWSAVVISLFSGTAAHVIGAVWSWARNRKGAKAQMAREQKQEEAATKQAEIDRQELLAEARHTAQSTALDSANSALAQVKQDCRECREELHGLRDITGTLIDAVEALMAEGVGTPQARADAHAAIRLARRVM